MFGIEILENIFGGEECCLITSYGIIRSHKEVSLSNIGTVVKIPRVHNHHHITKGTRYLMAEAPPKPLPTAIAKSLPGYWKEVPGYPGTYASIEGRIYLPSGRFSQARPDKYNGYVIATVRDEEGKESQHGAHILVALAHIPNPDNLPFVDHINHVRWTNRVPNLRWSSVEDNNNNATYNPRRISRAIEQYTLNNTFVRKWDSTIDAAHSLVEDSSNQKRIKTIADYIAKCCSGERKNSQGFIWKWIEEEKTPEEEWRSLTVTSKKGTVYNISVSSEGEVQLPTGYITKGYDHDGYCRVKLDDGCFRMVHGLICKAFHGEAPQKNMTPDHINSEERKNNRPSNLRWATKPAQWRNRKPFDAAMHTRSIVSINKEGNKKFHASLIIASRECNVDRHVIMLHIKQDKIHTKTGYKWRNATEEEIGENSVQEVKICHATKQELPSSKTPLVRITPEFRPVIRTVGDVETFYASAKEAADALGIYVKTLKEHLAGPNNAKTKWKAIWRYSSSNVPLPGQQIHDPATNVKKEGPSIAEQARCRCVAVTKDGITTIYPSVNATRTAAGIAKAETIITWIRNGTRKYGYEWRYANEDEEVTVDPPPLDIDDSQRPGLKALICIDGEKISTFESMGEATRITGTTRNAIKNAIKTKEGKMQNGVVWKYQN